MVSGVVQPRRWYGMNVCGRGEMEKMEGCFVIDKCK